MKRWKSGLFALIVVGYLTAQCSYFMPRQADVAFSSSAQAFFRAAFEKQTQVFRSRIEPVYVFSDSGGLWELRFLTENSELYAPALLADYDYDASDIEWFIKAVLSEWPDVSARELGGV